MFTPDNVNLPAPTFVKLPEVLIIPLMDRSDALVPSSATEKVRVVEFVNATGQLIVAPLFPVAALLIVTFPPNVNKPLPVIEEPVEAPPAKTIEVGEPNVKVDKAKVEFSDTVSIPLTIVLAGKFLVPDPDIVRLLTVAGSPVID